MDKHVWIVEYTVEKDDSCVLARGLRFRSIHDSEAAAQEFIKAQGREGYPVTITEYAPMKSKGEK